MTTKVSDATFESEVLKADGPVIVDFWAEWCTPCKVLGPLVDELSTELQGKAKVVKINIDESPNAPTKYGVRGIPTLMVFKNGQVTDTRVGALSKSQLKEWADGVL
jgi:thioredoxin 1